MVYVTDHLTWFFFVVVKLVLLLVKKFIGKGLVRIESPPNVLDTFQALCLVSFLQSDRHIIVIGIAALELKKSKGGRKAMKGVAVEIVDHSLN